MFLLSSNKFSFIFFLSLIFFLIQSNLPSIAIYNYNKINLDLILVFLTALVFFKDSYKIIFLAFFYGFIQDIIVNVNQFGILSFLKSFAAFLLLYIRKYDTIWDKKIKFLYVFLIYFLHFYLYYFSIYNNNYFSIFFISFMQSIVTFILFLLVNKFFIKVK